MKRVIVTGATGFVGANLARRLLREGHEVHLLVRPGYKSWRVEAIRPDVRMHELHLHDLDSVARAVSQIRPEWVFHLAVHGAYSTQTDLHEMVLTNIQGTINLITAGLKAGFEAFVNTGSSSEYGWKNHPPAETEVLEPNSYYAVTKASATLFCRYTAQHEKVHLPTLRLYSVYGAYEEPTRLIPTLIIRGLSGQLPPLVNPDIARDYVYVDDVVEAYMLAALRPAQEHGAIYNVGTGIQTTLREAVEVARRVMSIKAEPQWGTMSSRQWDTNCWIADYRLICQRLGWRPHHSFEAGFRKTVQWFENNADLSALYAQRLSTG